jgi:hypothetical protein
MSSRSNSNSSSYGYTSRSSSSLSSSQSEVLYDTFETIENVDEGLHVIYNPHAKFTYNHTYKYIPKTFQTKYQNLSVYIHNPSSNYKNVNPVDLWGMACSSLENTEHEKKEEDGTVELVHTCSPAMDGDYFSFDKLDSTTNMIILKVSKQSEDKPPLMTAFMLCRDLHESTMRKMRTKERQRQYDYNGDFFAYKNVEPEPCLYVDGLCSKERGIGKLIMSLLDVIVSKSKKYEAIKLAALTYVVKYYYNQGYRFTNSPNETFKKNMNNPELFKHVNEMVEKLPIITKDEEYTNKQVIDFINVIQQYKLFNSNYDTRITDEQKKRFQRPTTIYDANTDKFVKNSPGYRKKRATESHDLGVDGWYMYKMLNTNKKRRAKTPPRKGRTKTKKKTPSVSKSKKGGVRHKTRRSKKSRTYKTRNSKRK